MGSRSYLWAVVGGVVAAGVAGGAACVIADPPAALPAVTVRAPEIMGQSAVPPVTQILRAWPVEFIVPIEADPSLTVYWEFFIDYDPAAPDPVQSNSLNPVPADSDAGVRLLPFSPHAPALNECHTLELLVSASSFPFLHTPSPASGSDSVTWFYTPTGSLDDCPVFEAADAGSDGEASADSGEGGGD